MRLMLLKSSLIITALSLSSCATTIPDTRICTVAGEMKNGALCVTTISGTRTKVTLDGLIEMIEPQPERPDPANPALTLPARGGAIIQSADDFNRIKTALETTCRRLGSKCNYETRHVLQMMNVMLNARVAR